MRIIVTGGAGFVGSNLALDLQRIYPTSNISIIDNFSNSSYKNLLKFKGEIITDDLAFFDCESCFNPKPDIIFHNAATVDTTVHNEFKMMANNVEPFRKILRFCKVNDIKLIYASSSAVYGQHPPEPMVEEKKENPLNVYGFSKLAMDNMARKAIGRGQYVVGLRYFNIIGQQEQYKDKKTISMVYKLYHQIKNNRRPEIFKMGEQQRDNVHVNDIVLANILAMNTKPGIYNVGSGNPISFNEMISIISSALNKKNLVPKYIENENPMCYQNYTHADLTKSYNWMNYKPRYSAKKGIEDYIRYLERGEESYGS